MGATGLPLTQEAYSPLYKLASLPVKSIYTHFSRFSLLANEIIWSIVRTLIDNLPKAFREAQQKYYSTYNMQPTPRWKTCYALTDKYFTHATTLLYVNKRVKDDALKEVS